MEQKICPGCEEPEVEKRPACPLQCGSDKCKAYQNKSKFDPATKPIVWILGGPGCGKFTQCKKIMAKYGFTHLSTGDIIRAEVETGSSRAKCLASIMNRGGLVPNDFVLTVLKEAMEKKAQEGVRGFLIDGYPREKSQGCEFEKAIGRVSSSLSQAILFFDASVESLVSRVLNRAQTSDRSDDNMDTLKLRIATFLKHNQGVIEPYGDRVYRINADQSPDEIFVEVEKVLDPIVAEAEAAEAALQEARANQMSEAMLAFKKSETKLAGYRSLSLDQPVKPNKPASRRESHNKMKTGSNHKRTPSR
ncbi:adenylate kinase isoenzyme 1-like isoform X1 [Helicoverpa armigera]|uniref:adenylate kinase isoenzyme 1-like isoform X1 n=1 Tax=Helicoverpa armigera TaxID=29058 RepID=UPI00308369DB